MRILIAGDDPVSSRVLETTLTKWGHDVVAPDDGLEVWLAVMSLRLSLRMLYSETENIIPHLEESLCAVNEEDKQGYPLSLSIGAVLFDHDNKLSIDQLIGKADRQVS